MLGHVERRGRRSGSDRRPAAARTTVGAGAAMTDVVVPRATRTRMPVLLDLDLGQSGLVEQLGQLLDQLAVDQVISATLP